MKLQAKILFILVPLAVIPLLLLGGTAYTEITINTQQRALETLSVLTEQASENIRIQTEEIERLAHSLSNSKILDKFVQSTNVFEKYNVLMPDLMVLLQQYLDSYPEIISFRLRNQEGSEVLVIPEGNVQRHRHNFPDMSVQNKKSVSVVYAELNPPLFVHTVKLFQSDPITGKRTLLNGFLEIVSSLKSIDQVIQQAINHKYGAVFFADRNGNQLRDIASLQLADSQNLPPVNDLISQGQDIYPQPITFEGQTAYLQGKAIHDDLYMFSMLTEQQIRESSQSYFRRMIGIITISVFLFTALGFLAVKYLLIKPLQQLGAAAQYIGEGNLSFTLDINNKDELGELATSLKEMSRNLRQSNEQIRYFAYHDSLTKLPNRLMFGEYLGHALAHARRHEQALALMYLDLDDFKVINDTLGHQAGDEVLRELSKRLADCLRADDYLGRPASSNHPKSETETVARLGGDEFIIFLPNINSPYEAATVANRVLESLAIPFYVENRQLHVSASIGITTYPKDGTDAETLIKNADMAMYHAKDKGKNAYSYYQESMNVAAFERLNMQNEMRQALARNEFILHYQPQVDLNTRKIVSVEALVRWQHPEKGLIGPARFIPLAEQSELIVPIGEWVIQTACRQARLWHDEGYRDLCVSVNVSPAQLHRHDLNEVIQLALLSNNLPAESLEIELTETALSNSDEIVFETLTAIKSLGVGIAMDDFGTGYSSLSYLSKLPIDKLKVDRSFVQAISPDNSHAPIISAILAMAHSLELPVTAEGVEIQAQIDFLKDKGCGMIQGYLISHPVTAEQISLLLEENITC